MDEPAQWHARIEASPDDLELREVYGDWLLARGEVLGELIQLECKALRMPDHADVRRWRLRAGKLRKAHQAELFVDCPRVEIRGGMVEEVKLWVGDDTRLRGQLDELLARAPALTRVEVDGRMADSVDPRVSGHPVWRRLRRIEAHAETAPFVLELLRRQALPSLTALRVARAPADVIGAILELLAERAPALARLVLPDVEGRIELAALARLADLSELVALDLYACELDADAVETLATSGALAEVEELWLGGTKLGLAGLTRLIASGTLGSLQRLDLRRCGLRGKPGEVGEALLALAQATPGLRSLELMNARLGVADLGALVDPALWPALEELSLHGCDVGDGGLLTLLHAGRLTRLVALSLRGNQLTDAALVALAGGSGPTGLRLLNLEGNPVSDKALRRLAAAPGFAGTTVTAGTKMSLMWSSPHNDRHGVWLGSTNHRAQDVVAGKVARPGQAPKAAT